MSEEEVIEKIRKINDLLSELREFPNLNLELNQIEGTYFDETSKHYLYNIIATIERRII